MHLSSIVYVFVHFIKNKSCVKSLLIAWNIFTYIYFSCPNLSRTFLSCYWLIFCLDFFSYFFFFCQKLIKGTVKSSSYKNYLNTAFE